MKLRNLTKIVTALTVATTLQLFSAAKLVAQNAYTIIALRGNNTLVRFGSDREIRVTGIDDGRLLGIDFRPSNGLLYGVTDSDKIYTINPNTGAATYVSTLSTSFNGGFQSGIDFNPVADRLRIVGSNDQNFRVNVDTGAVSFDTPLAFAAGDANAGVDPNITAAAYTNSRAGATSTQLFGIDYDLNALVLQNPPNNGILTTRVPLGINFDPLGGFDIFTDAGGMNTAFVVSGPTLYTIDLSTGAATRLGFLSGSSFIGLAVTRR